MSRLGIAASGKTLGRAEGLADLSGLDLAYIVRRGALTAVSIGALIAGLAATSAAVQGFASNGVSPEPRGGIVLSVSTTGYGWGAGVRPGQRVIELRPEDDDAGWFIKTTDGSATYSAAAGPHNQALHDSLPVAVGALVLAYLSVVFLRTRRRLVLPTASAALLAAAIPVWIQGLPDVSTTVMGAALLVPAGSIAWRVPLARWVRLGLVAALVGFVGSWGFARLTGAPAADALEGIRGAIAVWAVVALIGERVILPVVRGEPIGVMRPRLVDVGVIAAVALVALILLNVLRFPPLTVIVLLVVAVVALPTTRRRFAQGIEEALFGDVREAAAAEAAEHERARLARELHDVPLQELVAVIRRLEILPGAEAESENLRALAGHLRNVATELRPPVLDDLGLPAALDYLAEETTSEALPVTAEVVDDTGFGADRRPPADVELAMYRIASEAVLNAVRHSGGTGVGIAAEVAPDRVQLVVADNGGGLAADAGRDAAKRKRLGLASMRRRAQAIDAELSIDGSERGTEVRVVWQA